MQCLPLLRGVLSGVPGDGTARDGLVRRSPLPRERRSQLRRMPVCLPVRATARSPHRRAGRDVLTLKHLHATGDDCVDAEETRRPRRRWMHHCTFYGFAFCFASTTVAAIYHLAFGWIAPYAYTSIPVMLGALGGVGLLIG